MQSRPRKPAHSWRSCWRRGSARPIARGSGACGTPAARLAIPGRARCCRRCRPGRCSRDGRSCARTGLSVKRRRRGRWPAAIDVDERVARPRSDRRERKPRSLPRSESARQFADAVEAPPLQQARGNRGSVSAGAVHEQCAACGQFARALREMVQGQVDAAGNVLGRYSCGPRTSTSCGGSFEARRSAATAGLRRSVDIVNSGRDSRLCASCR